MLLRRQESTTVCALLLYTTVGKVKVVYTKICTEFELARHFVTHIFLHWKHREIVSPNSFFLLDYCYSSEHQVITPTLS